MALLCLLVKNLFQFHLGSERRVSEFHLLSRHKLLLKFNNHLFWIDINPNSKFLAKDEMVRFKKKPILLQARMVSP